MRINPAGNLLVNTTTDNGNLSVYTIATGIHINANHAGDWYQSMITATNRANSANYVVKLNGTTKFYVAGQGWIFSDGNYLGSDKNIKDEIKSIDSAMSKVNKINGVTYKLVPIGPDDNRHEDHQDIFDNSRITDLHSIARTDSRKD